MTLPKLDAIIQAAEDATPRPWLIRDRDIHCLEDFHAGGDKPGTRWYTNTVCEVNGWSSLPEPSANAAYIVQAANAAPEMARLLKEVYEYLSDPRCHCMDIGVPGHLVDCEHNAYALAGKIEARFGQEDKSA